MYVCVCVCDYVCINQTSDEACTTKHDTRLLLHNAELFRVEGQRSRSQGQNVKVGCLTRNEFLLALSERDCGDVVSVSRPIKALA